MRIKIISDGTAENTQVVNADTNEAVPNILKVQFSAQAGNKPTVDITFRLTAENYTLELPIKI